MSTTNDFNSQVADVATMPHPAKNLNHSLPSDYLYSPKTMQNIDKYYDEVHNRMFGRLDDDSAESWQEEIKDTFDYHLNKLKKICEYIISETTGADVWNSKDYYQARDAESMLKTLNTMKSNTVQLISSLTEDMSERLFVEFCENPI